MSPEALEELAEQMSNDEEWEREQAYWASPEGLARQASEAREVPA